MQIPFFEKIATSKRILLAGVGGGFDIACGIPLYLYLRRIGKEVVLANLSFTYLSFTDSEEICPGAYQVTSESQNVPYFPEKFIVDWLVSHGENPYMYGFSNKIGVKPLSNAYAKIVAQHDIDTLLLVDGGTDSLMFGDEVGVGTIVEDACSILAASNLGMAQSYLVATGFGVEKHHNLDHYSCLENISTLIKEDAYLGAISLTKDMEDGRRYLEFVQYINARLSSHKSIVNNSIASAMSGEFGDYHASVRTKNSTQFINPFMGLFWFFTLEGVSSHIAFKSQVENSETMNDFINGFQQFREMSARREAKKIPL